MKFSSLIACIAAMQLLTLGLVTPVRADALLSSRVPVVGPDDVKEARVLKSDAKQQ